MHGWHDRCQNKSPMFLVPVGGVHVLPAAAAIATNTPCRTVDRLPVNTTSKWRAAACCTTGRWWLHLDG